MELKYLYTFRVVAQELSFTNAAYKLNYSQSSVSDHIRALESELGIPLFERMGKQVVITEAGERMLSLTDKIISDIENIKESVYNSEIPSGKLIIGAHESQLIYRLTHILKKFRFCYPNVQLVFQPLISDENVKELLERRILDTAFLLGSPLSIPGIVIKPLVKEHILFLSGTDHPLAQQSHVVPSDFSNETILTTEKGCAYRQIFEQLMASSGVRTGVKIEFTSIEAIKQCVIAGLGIAVLPEIAVKNEISQHQIAVLPCKDLEYSVVTQLAWHKDKWISPSLKAFLNVAAESIRSC